MTEAQLERLKIITIYMSIPSFEKDAATDSELAAMGLIEMNRHGARITEKGIEEIKKRGILK